jgi:hypothetical protein
MAALGIVLDEGLQQVRGGGLADEVPDAIVHLRRDGRSKGQAQDDQDERERSPDPAHACSSIRGETSTEGAIDQSRMGDSRHAHSGAPPIAVRRGLRFSGRPESRLFAGIGLRRCRCAGGFRPRALLGFLLRGGLFGVLDGLEAVALTTFELVIRFTGHGSPSSVRACHSSGMIVGTREEAPPERRLPATQYPIFARRYLSASSSVMPRRRA